jgi:uncharacterized protein (DUF4415 family)
MPSPSSKTNRRIKIDDDHPTDVWEREMKREYYFDEGERGPVVTPQPGKTRITIRIDDQVLNWFRRQVHEAGGGNYQTLINAALREYIGLREEDLDAKVRRVVREELSLAEGRVARAANTAPAQGRRLRRRTGSGS